MIRLCNVLAFGGLLLAISSCASVARQKPANFSVTLITVAPGHFHAALIQKQMYPQVNPIVYVYAPAGPELESHLERIEQFNTRKDNPTAWRAEVYRGKDYVERALRERKGNVVMLSGDNAKKIRYIKTFVDAGFHVYADKPMCIDKAGFEQLKAAFATAAEKGTFLYDIMTERYQINTVIQRRLAQMPDVFGQLQKGTPDDPAIVLQSVHHFCKNVAGKPLVRPAWFFDTRRQGEGIVDVMTHLVDLAQWLAFPDTVIHYDTDVRLLSARRWPTLLSAEQFRRVTGLNDFPDDLKPLLNTDGVLPCYANGQIDYTLNGAHVRVKVEWLYQAPEGAPDTHYSLMRGSKADLLILQCPEQNYKPELYVKPAAGVAPEAIASSLHAAISILNRDYPGITTNRQGDRWHIVIPDRYRIGHEAHFAKVTEKYLGFLQEGRMPEWEVPNMIAKYYITTTALEMARQ